MCLVSSGDGDGGDDGECDEGADGGEGDVDGFVGHVFRVVRRGGVFVCFGLRCLVVVVG